MATEKQKLGDFGEKIVQQNCSCPKCKKENTLKLCPRNFKCADLICDFCGYLAQVKSKKTKNINKLPNRLLGAAWIPQKERMDAGIYFPLFVVLVENFKSFSVFYLSADIQVPEMFVPRKPLSKNAKRAGWQGFYIDIEKVGQKSFVKVL